MKVLHALPSLDQAYGGPIRLVMDLSALCLPLGLDSEVVGIGALNLPDNPLPADRIHAFPEPLSDWQMSESRLRSWLGKQLPLFDCAIIHGAWTRVGWCVARECQKQGIPYGAFPHGMLDPWAVDGQGALKSVKKRLYWALVERHVFQKATSIFFTTQREAALANTVFRFPSRQTVLSVYGLTRPIAPVLRPSRRALDILGTSPYALFLGRVHPKKNVDFLLRAWAAASLPPDWRLVIAGPADAAYDITLHTLVDKLGLRERVLFVGFASGDDKRYLLQCARWFLLPSKQENFGVAVLEALAHGCPVAISDRVYLAEAFRVESEVLPLDLDAWIEFLQFRMTDPEWRDAVLREDLDHLMERFRVERVAREWIDGLARELGPTSHCDA